MGSWLPFLLLLALDGALSQRIDCANPADIMFLIDGSDSIDTTEWNQAREFVSNIIGDLDIGPDTIHVGMTVYSSAVKTHIGLTPFKQQIVLKALASKLQHPTGISTNTAAGIQKIRDTFRTQPASRRNAPKIAIVITDGSSENPAETINQATQAKAEGIRIISVGVGRNTFEEELKRIATNSRKYYPVADYTALRSIEADLRSLICRVITTSTLPPITFAPPTRPPLVPLSGDRICNVPGDVVFVIDGSDSISDGDYTQLKNFVANLIDNFEIGPDAIHVGMVVYSSTVGETVGLEPPKNKMLLKFLAKNLEHPRFGTDTGAGIEAARSMIRDQGRPQAPEIIVVITDGRSTNPTQTTLQSQRAKASGITMIAIGVGQDIFSEELNRIASGRNFVSEVADFQALQNTVNTMRNLICLSITTTPKTPTTVFPPTPPPSIPPPAEGLICNVPGDVMFLLDGSDSIAPADWMRQRNFVSNLINNLEVGPTTIHVGIVVFSTTIGDSVDLTPYKPKPVLSAMISGLTQPRFGTDTALGIKKVRDVLKKQGRRDAPKVIMIVTDGKSKDNELTKLEAHRAKADGATMIAVGVGSDIYEDELRQVATSPRKVFKVADFAALQNIIGELRDIICQVIKTTTMAPPTTTPALTTTPMTTPTAVQLVPCADSRTEADMVFLIDGSRSMSDYDWMMETHFVSNFLDGLEIQEQFVHVGITISDHARGDSVGISPFKTRYRLKEIAHKMMHPRGDMDTATGIRKVQQIFKSQGRPNAQKLMVLVTDGRSRSKTETINEAGRLKENGVTVVSVGVGPSIDLNELRSVSSQPSYVMISRDADSMFMQLRNLQSLVCELLRKPTTTTPAPTTPTVPGLCDGCLIESGVGYNPYPGDCTQYVQCWKQGSTVQALVRSCPFGQYWDSDAITCRPSFLVHCPSDPCRTAPLGFTYSMEAYGCRAYWMCIGGQSVGHCCPEDSVYVQGMGCLEGEDLCIIPCPPPGGIAVRPTCNKKPHWDNRYYIEIVPARGEVVRPCPAGTVFIPEQCFCDFGMSGLLPSTPQVLCHPSAHFPFTTGLQDQSQNKINVGLTNVRRTDLGTAYFSGRSEMNLWRFAGADWGSTLVIKFKFRFDHSNKFVDYGGLPVDLGPDFNVNMNLLGNFTSTVTDWQVWNGLRRVHTLNDWRRLLKNFGNKREFYLFINQLGFKPGTSNSLQVIRILGTPEAFAHMKVILQKLRTGRFGTMETGSVTDLQNILTHLRSLKGFINWNKIIRQLRGDKATGSTTGGATDTTTEAKVVVVPSHGTGGTGTGTTGTMGTGSATGAGETIRMGQWVWNSRTGTWHQEAGGSGSGGTTVTGGGAGGTTVTGGGTGQTGGGATGAGWKWNTVSGEWEMNMSGSGTGNTGNIGGLSGGTVTGGTAAGSSASGGLTLADIMQKMKNMQGSSGSWHWNVGAGGKNITTQKELFDEIRRQLQSAGVVVNTTGGSGVSQGASSSWQTGSGLDSSAVDALMKELQLTTGGQGWQVGSGWGHRSSTQGGQWNVQMPDWGSFITSGGKAAVITGGMGSNTGSGYMTGTATQGTGTGTGAAAGTGTGATAGTGTGAGTKTTEAHVSVVGGRVVGGAFVGSGSSSGGTTGSQTVTGEVTGAGSAQNTGNAGTVGKTTEAKVVVSGGRIVGSNVVGAGSQQGLDTGSSTAAAGGAVQGGSRVTMTRTVVSGGASQTSGSQQNVLGTSASVGGRGTAGDNALNVDGQIVGIRFPKDGGIITGGNVIGKEEQMVRVTNTEPQLRVKDIVQEIKPVSMPAGSQGGAGVATGNVRILGGRFEGTLTDGSNVGVSGAGARGGTRVGASGGRRLVQAVSSAPQGDFTQFGRIAGSGGGVKRVIDTHVKRLPPGSVPTNPDGSLDLSALGLDGIQGADIIRRTVRVGPDGTLIGTGAGGEFLTGGSIGGLASGGFSGSVSGGSSSSSAGGFSGSVSGGSSGSSSGGSSGSMTGFMTGPISGGSSFDGMGGGSSSGSSSGDSSGGRSVSMEGFIRGPMSSGSSSGGLSGGSSGGRSGSMTGFIQGPVSGGLSGSMAAMNLLPFGQDSAENFFDAVTSTKRRKRSAPKRRRKRAASKLDYQALVTNCQGRGNQGPSIVMVANHEDIQFALKTYNHAQPAVVTVPLVDGWNDVTMIYDGQTLSGVVENWRGIQKSSAPLTGDIERRQAGLLVGSCDGYANFNGEVDDLTVYHCITPEITALSQRAVG